MIQSKICIVTTRNIMDAPCLEKYQKIITQPFDIVYWDRSGTDEECGANGYFKYTGKMSVDIGFFQKLRNYVNFFRFVNSHLKTHKYEKIIVFPTQAAWLILNHLVKSYKNKYILDIRDYAGEYNPVKGFLTRKAIENAGLCSITSKAYQEFLPKHRYIVSHNIQAIDAEIVNTYRQAYHNKDDAITFSFIGTVRFIEQQKKFITALKNDRRFHLNYIGRGSEQLKEFCQNNDVKNITLMGRFKREDLPNYYANTSAAINVYGNNDPYLDFALSNKLYSAAIMGMPILVSPNTYMAKIVEEYNIGYVVDYSDENMKDKLYDWYVNLDFEQLHKSCDAFISEVMKEEETYAQSVGSFLNEESLAT